METRNISRIDYRPNETREGMIGLINDSEEMIDQLTSSSFTTSDILYDDSQKTFTQLGLRSILQVRYEINNTIISEMIFRYVNICTRTIHGNRSYSLIFSSTLKINSIISFSERFFPLLNSFVFLSLFWRPGYYYYYKMEF